MKVGTHSGRFHADDVFAVATLKLVGILTELVRTRELDVLAGCELRVDIGRSYDPQKGNFDHHQPGGAGVRSNGVPYASFGLVWREYGKQAAGSDEVAAYVDGRLVQQVDAADVGFDMFSPKLTGVQLYDVSHIIGCFNPSREDDPTPERMDELFAQAVDFALSILKREIANAREHVAAEATVRAVIAQAADPRVLVFEHYTHWRDAVLREAPQALFVLYPVWPAVRNQWSVQAVPKGFDSFELRRQLPEAWAGKSGEELAAVTGVDDAVFCHAARFLVIAESKAGALRLAQLAMEAAV